MRKRIVLFVVPGLLAGILSAEPSANLQAQIKLFRSGRRVWTPGPMQTARDGFAEMVRRQPGAYLPLYWQSVSEFYLLLYYGLEESAGYDPVRAERLLDDAEKTMTAAIDARPQDAECRALLSAVVGFKIKNNPLTAVWNGPRVLSLQSDALDNEPDNRRALYIIGAGYFRAPRVFRKGSIK